ncbi:MAG: 4Fe-4S binding protein [Ignavibacteria bacterium]|jgi:polyferredoxin
MTIKRRLFLTVLLFLFPLLIFAQEHDNFRGGRSFLDFILSLKYFVVFLFAGLALFFLWFGDFSMKVRIGIVSASFIIFGVLPLYAHYLFITPSPICASTKPFLFGFKPQFLATLSAIGVLSLVSVKGFCSTACPVGGLQELLYKIPTLRKFKIPFRISNSARITLFILFLVVAFSLKTSTYYYYNLFDLVHWNFNMPLWDLIEYLVFLLLILTASIYFFKPFCYLICPMGLYTWVLEHFSFLKIRIDIEKCNGCGVCEKQAPCSSVSAIVNEKLIRGDCHLCGVCLTECKFGALYYGRPIIQKNNKQ